MRDFDHELLQAWGDVIQYIYDNHLQWAFSTTGILPEEKIEKVLDSMTTWNLDLDSFKSMYGLWCKMNVDVDSHFVSLFQGVQG